VAVEQGRWHVAGALHKNILDCGYGDAISLIIFGFGDRFRIFGDASVDWFTSTRVMTIRV